MRKRREDIILGLGLSAGMDEPLKAVENMPEDFFTGIEMPFSMLETEKGPAVLLEHDWKYIHISELMDNSLCGRIAEQSPSIIREFVHKFDALLERVHAFGANSITVDFSLETAVNSPEIYASLKGLVKRLMPKLYETGINLCIPVRMPSASPDLPPETHLNFLRELMFPGIRFAINVHPHQLGRDFSPEKLMRWHRFDTDVLRFVYEAEMGNRLVKKLIGPWTEHLRKSLFNGMLVFCPRISGADAFISEASSLREMLSIPEKAGAYHSKN